MTTRTRKPTATKPKRAAASPAAASKVVAAKPHAAAKAKGERAAPPPPPKKAASEPKRARRAEPDAPVHEPAVIAQIRALEAQLERLIDEASRHDISSLDLDDEGEDADADADDAALEDAETTHDERRREPTFDDGVSHFDAEATVSVARPSAPLPESRPSASSVSSFGAGPGAAFGAGPGPAAASAVPPAPESVFDTARELLSSDFYLRKWGRLAMRGRSEEVDDFGFDPIYDAKLKPVLDFLYTKYFRVETSGISSVPKTGRCLLVANHSGTLPLDGLMIKAAVKREGREVRWLTEDFIYHMPFLGGAMNRLGAVRACQENAERLLGKEQLVAVFPEGVKGIGKLFADRYRLQRFGRGGFIKLCLRTGTPIVPVAVTGAEETNPLLFKIEHLSKALGVPYVPVTPTFPLLGPLGLLPAPTKWTIQFGEPLDLSSHGPSAADDEILVGKLAERVRATIQGMLDRTVGSRKSVFFG
jgi:1-acyl-sn-glycerol-3-phosphate acyltransferase